MAGPIDGLLRCLKNRNKARVRQLVKEGWTVTKTNGGHLRFTHPNGNVVISSMTSGDRRSSVSFEADIRRAEKSVDG